MSTNAPISIGIATIDITPNEAIRLSGYGNRRQETAQIETRLYAKALALGDDEPLLLLTLENCGISQALTDQVAAQLHQRTGLAPEHLLICYSHTHTAPCLSDTLPMLFSSDIPPAHRGAIDRYTDRLVEQLVGIGVQALTERFAGYLSYATGHVGFAANRRSQVGPVDHIMPMLRIADSAGNLRGVWLSYACHCTTLAGDDNYISGDWAGLAQTLIEAAFPGATAFVSIGCAADSNPFPRTGPDYVRQHGEDIAREAQRLLSGPFTAISGNISSVIRYIDLPYDALPTREQWLAKAAAGGAVGYHAEQWLARLDRGEKIPTSYSYPIQVWTLGDELAMVFFAGEVVADYAFNLRQLYQPQRLWIGAYANAFPGYIPSQRIWREGGYEGGDATVYFGLPNRFDEKVEILIVDAVRAMLPASLARQS